MLRRFEIYGLRSDAAPEAVTSLVMACRRSGDFIPEVLHSRVGWSRTGGRPQLVWEHAFGSPASYQRYMVHPYHASVLDRFLLHDSPERVVVDTDLGAGLVGYHCDGPVFAMAGGIRRLVLLRIDDGASPDEISRLRQALAHGPVDDDRMTLSVSAANTLGAAWFDGMTPVGPPPRFTHLWEQGFADLDMLDGYRAGTSALATAERRGWEGWMDGIVTRTASLHYEIDGPRI